MPEIKLGLITAPGYSERFGEGLEEEMHELLNYYIDDQSEWRIELVENNLVSGTNMSEKVLVATHELLEQHSWNYAIALTDLPVFKENKPVVAEAYNNYQVALISIPGFGFTPTYKRMCEAVLQMMNEMYYGSTDQDREMAEARIKGQTDDRYKYLQSKTATALMGKRFFEFLSPIKRVTAKDDRTTMDVRFTSKSVFAGYLRVITGMVAANRPWELFPVFGKILIIAFSAGAYTVIFPTVWILSDNYTVGRLITLTLFSILLLLMWIILSHSLWQHKDDQYSTYTRRMYNAATFFTLLTTVLMYYVLLYALFTVSAFIIIPAAGFEEELGREPEGLDFFRISWMATSFSTIIGALGSALEDEETVLNSTYGYRQRRRHEMIRKKREEKKDDEEKADREAS